MDVVIKGTNDGDGGLDDDRVVRIMMPAMSKTQQLNSASQQGWAY